MIYLGLDIGIRTAKLAVVKNGTVLKLYSFSLPEDLPREEGDNVALSEELALALKAFLKKEGISTRHCALALPPGMAFIRRITMPCMTAKHIRANLPYEFRDYIQGDKSLYFYDYAVMEVIEPSQGSSEGKQLDLLITASSKQVIEDWRKLLQKAGLKLTVAVPKYLTYRNLISVYERNHREHPQEYCIAELGDRRLRLHMYHGNRYETTSVIEYGEGVLTRLRDPDLPLEEQRELYQGIALEILRGVNFYSFNNPKSHLQHLYFGGELALSPVLRGVLKESLALRIHSMEELLPWGDGQLVQVCFAAVGAALEGNMR